MTLPGQPPSPVHPWRLAGALGQMSGMWLALCPVSPLWQMTAEEQNASYWSSSGVPAVSDMNKRLESVLSTDLLHNFAPLPFCLSGVFLTTPQWPLSSRPPLCTHWHHPPFSAVGFLLVVPSPARSFASLQTQLRTGGPRACCPPPGRAACMPPPRHSCAEFMRSCLFVTDLFASFVHFLPKWISILGGHFLLDVCLFQPYSTHAFSKYMLSTWVLGAWEAAMDERTRFLSCRGSRSTEFRKYCMTQKSLKRCMCRRLFYPFSAVK